MVRSLSVLASLLVLGGCFRYAPVEPAAVEPQTTVRAHLTPGGAQRHQALLGLDDGHLEGTVAGVDDDELQLLTGGVGTRSGATVTLSWGEIDGLERRHLDRGRTLLVAGAGVALGVAVLALVEGGPFSDGGTGGDRDFTRVPLIRLRVP